MKPSSSSAGLLVVRLDVCHLVNHDTRSLSWAEWPVRPRRWVPSREICPGGMTLIGLS